MNPIEIANNAVDKGFQWWFLALLSLVLGCGTWALRYLLNNARDDRKSFDTHLSSLIQDSNAARERHHVKVESMQAEALSVVREVTSALAGATKVIESNTRESMKVCAVVERIERNSK